MDANGNVVAEFPGFGVYQYTNGGGWQFLTGSEASLLGMDGNGDIAANFPGHGL